MRFRPNVALEPLESRQHLSIAPIGPSALTASAGVATDEMSTRTFNVRNYGAKGDSIHDDGWAIQTAMNAVKANGGGTLLLPPGEYRISKALRMENVKRFVISGVGATIKPLDHMSTTGIAGDTLQFAACSSFTIKGLALDGNELNRSAVLPALSIRLDGVSDFRISDCAFSDAVTDDLYIAAGSDNRSSRDGVVENCTFDGARRNAISVIAGQGLELTGNRIANVRGLDPGDGIDIESNVDDAEGANRDIVINRNTFTDIAHAGVSVIATKDPRNIRIDSNEFENCPVGIRVMTDGCVVSNNYFHDASRPASGKAAQTLGQVVVGGYANASVRIDSNRIENITDMSGIYVHSNWDGSVFIENNTVRDIHADNRYLGIAVWCDDAVITGNRIENIDGIGIGVDGGNAQIGSNALSNGTHSAIYYTGSGGSIWKNVIHDYGMSVTGRCIMAVGGSVGVEITENFIRNWDVEGWVGISADARDILSENTLQGVL